MHLGKIYSVQTDLALSNIIEIEIDITKNGLPSFSVVGLPDKAVEESKERVCSALKNSSYTSPKQFKTVVSLSPAGVKKQGPHYDLPIALGILLANQDEDLNFDTTNKCFIGELALDGSVKTVDGILALAQCAQKSGCTSLYVPAENAAEAALLSGITIFPVSSLSQLVNHLSQELSENKQLSLCITPQEPTVFNSNTCKPEFDFAHIIDQQLAKRALLIAAAGGHNVAMYGPAGTGKTMLAKAFTGILPPLEYNQMLQSTMIHSYVGTLGSATHLTAPPFRAPHHTSSYVSVVGGGTYPKPGEISLAHNGVLFLDEFPEFDKRVLESLREPLEDHEIRISRSQGSVTFPAKFILLAAMNPPSAVYRDNALITPAARRSFSQKISGPIMDRIDLWTEVSKIDHTKLLGSQKKSMDSGALRKQVIEARNRQYGRLGLGRCNAYMNVVDIEKYTNLSPEAKKILDNSSKKLDISPRVYHKLIKLGQTIADLEQSDVIDTQHILEALQYRPRDII